ncbi:hypothetical protein RA27_20560 [Ruegeria sp. ANG-R]|uniref:phage major tail tube protein n=1 Tax=Ruegeria sp. ANG-R TaxID=1577903 RepID=UPI00057F15F8|nr:phage major tail tube protein [Ruegeria sp. ANG-R]KIC38159.1 hypothetical protein RA27_20560 [Ruegeria sp. ANG-R]
MLQYGQVTDAPTYLDDKELLGICNGFTIPEMESRTIEHDTLGSVGVLMLPGRSLAGLTGSIKLMFPEPEMVSIFSRPNKAAKFQVHQKIDVFDADGLNEEKSTTLVTHVKALFNKSAFAEVKKGEAQEATGEFSATYLMQRLSSSEVPLVEIDLFANIYKVNGEDVWPD